MRKELGLKRKAFETRFKGPFVIKGKVNVVTFEVEDNVGRRYRRHRDHLKKTNIEPFECHDESIHSDFRQNNKDFSYVEDKKTVIKSYPTRDRKKVDRYGFI